MYRTVRTLYDPAHVFSLHRRRVDSPVFRIYVTPEEQSGMSIHRQTHHPGHTLKTQTYVH